MDRPSEAERLSVWLAGDAVPHAHRLIVRRGHEPPAIRAEPGAVDGLFVLQLDAG